MLSLQGHLQVCGPALDFDVFGRGQRLVACFQRRADLARLLQSFYQQGWRPHHLAKALTLLEKLQISLEGQVAGQTLFVLGPAARSTAPFRALGLKGLEIHPAAALDWRRWQ